MEFLLTFLLVALLLAPLYGIYRRKVLGRPVRTLLITQVLSFFAAGLLLAGLSAGGALAAQPAAETAAGGVTDMAWGMIAAALSTGLSGIGGGVAVAAAASAALGAISENDKTFGKAVLFVGLAEGIALYGFVISFMILGKFA